MKRRWRITVGINHYWLSEEEKDYYLKSVQDGNDYVVLGNKILSRQFLDIVSEEEIKAVDMIDQGKYLCAHGYWHSRGAECLCLKSVIIEDGKAKLV